jgi:hypothetical protein
MGKVAREMVEKAGNKVEQLLKKLVAAAGAEAEGAAVVSFVRVPRER